MFRKLRLTNEPGGLGPSCTSSGLLLAGTPLLRKAKEEFEPRPKAEIGLLLKSAYGVDIDPRNFEPGLSAVARALNAGDEARAMLAALRLGLPLLSKADAARLALVDQALAKYSPDQPRDWHGRWTSGGDGGPQVGSAPTESPEQASSAADMGEDASVVVADALPAEDREPAHAVPVASSSQRGASEDEVQALKAIYPSLVSKYDDLDAVEFSKAVTSYGIWLAQHGKYFTPSERIDARVEYTFLQNRLNFWIWYKYKSAIAADNLLSAASYLYQGAINGRIIDAVKDDLPRSMLAVAGVAALYDGPSPRMRGGRFRYEPEEPAPPEIPFDQFALGGVVNNSEVKIQWGKGKGPERQGLPWQIYNDKRHGPGTALPPGAKVFDNFHTDTGRAISSKTLDTTAYTYAANPTRVYTQIAKYVDQVAGYSKPRTYYDLKVDQIRLRQIDLAMTIETTPEQKVQLKAAEEYARSRKVLLLSHGSAQPTMSTRASGSRTSSE